MLGASSSINSLTTLRPYDSLKTLEGKVDGLGKRLDNQEFLNRGVVVAVLAALIAGAAKLFGVLPKG